MVSLSYTVPEQFVEHDMLVVEVTEKCELGSRSLLHPMDWVIKRAARRWSKSYAARGPHG